MFDYQLGCTITYRDFLGGLRSGVVVNRDPDIKNGRPGFDLAAEAGGRPFAWGYDSQIVPVNATCPGCGGSWGQHTGSR